MFVTTFDMDT